MQVKERAIYQLPNGRELVVRVSGDNKVVLYNLSALHQGEYEMNKEGRLLLNGQLTAWGKADLIETGRTAPRDLPGVLLEDPAMDVDVSYELNLNSRYYGAMRSRTNWN